MFTCTMCYRLLGQFAGTSQQQDGRIAADDHGAGSQLLQPANSAQVTVFQDAPAHVYIIHTQ